MNILDHCPGMPPKPTANLAAKGPEFHGPCPIPGCPDGPGENRFHVWPDQDEGRGSFWCRQCGKAGDAIQFFRDAQGMTFKQAARAAGKDVADSVGFRQDAGMRAREFVPAHPSDPVGVDRGKWTEAAEKFVDRCHQALLADPKKLDWLERRGVVRDQAVIHRLGWHAGENDRNCAFRAREGWGLPTETKPSGRNKPLWIPRGLVVPAHEGGRPVRIKIRRPKADRTQEFSLPYIHIKGGRPGALVTTLSRKVYVIVEAELDAMAVAAAAGDLVGVAALGTATAKPDADLYPHLAEAHKILVALDAGEEAGAVASRWWLAEFPRAARWPVPKGKDPGEAVQAGVSLRHWILAGLPPSVVIGASIVDRYKSGSEDRTSKNFSKGGGAEDSEEGTGPDAAAPDADAGETERPSVPEALTRFYEYLRKYPVSVYSGADSTRLVEGKSWRDWDKSKEISQMLFFNPVVLDYVRRHPAETIHRGNFWDGLGAAR